MKCRGYKTSLPGKISGIVTINARGSVMLVPAHNFLPGREITRDSAAQILREYRNAYRLKRFTPERHQLVGGIQS
jgi:hypothetical protein